MIVQQVPSARTALFFLVIAAALCASAPAQTAGLSAGSASGAPGSSVTIPVAYTAGPTAVSTLQFDLLFSSYLSYVADPDGNPSTDNLTGQAALAAGKSASAAPLAGGVRILVFGLNLNALGSGVVANVTLQISGSAPAGSIPLTLAGIAGSDPTGTINVPITSSNGSVTVVAPADVTPPAISGVAATNITSSGATITWTTNEPSDTQVEYGTTTAYGSSTALNSSLVTSHSQALSGLTGGTLYHYRVKSKDAAGNPATSADYTFTTLDGTPPAISGVAATNITSSGATITWTTNEASSTQVEYGTTTGYGSSTALNAAMVTSHSQALTGLTGGTLYHYRVKSRDAAGNPAESGDYIFTTLAEEDRTAPTISSVRAVNISSRSATINWTTDEASDTQVEYGTTTGYGSSTALNAALVTSHSQALTGLNPETLYHYRVKSRDAAGNPAVSADYTFTTEANSSAPVISEITVTDVTGKSAKISWTTDKPSDSEVEYWASPAASRIAASGDPVTKHVLSLNGLQKGTAYRFHVRSRDADGNQAVSPELVFTTSESGAPTLVLPRFALNPGAGAPATEIIMGMALANLDSEDAGVTFTATDGDGNLVAGPDIVNPNVVRLAAGKQLPTHDVDLFGESFPERNSDLWVMLDSDNPGVNGLFMLFDGDLRLMDGANFAQGPITNFAFTEIQANGRNKIGIMNANPEDAAVTLELVKADGTVRSSQTRVIRANGALAAELFVDLFPDSKPDAAEYVRVRADRGVYPFQMTRQQLGDIAILPGQDMLVGGTRIFSPQYVVGGPYRTTISVVNLDPRDGMILLRLFGEDGNQIGSTRLLTIRAHGKVHIDEQMFFLTPDPDAMVTGYVEIVSDGVRLAGSTVFGDRKGLSFITALALVSELQSSVVFSHVASSDRYFTGIAIFNPNDRDVIVRLELYSAEGALVERKWEMIPAGRRRARLVSEYFSALAGTNQTSGYIRLTSSNPIASFALFGTWDLSVLSAIPPQVIQ